jgi:hypothetical protein
MQETIDLTKYIAAQDIVLSGRPKGEELRKKLNLDGMEQQLDSIKFVIPQQVVSLNSSFFLGLFTNSVRRFGESGFRSKYSFECRQILLKDIEAGILQALNTSNPLAPPKK